MEIIGLTPDAVGPNYDIKQASVAVTFSGLESEIQNAGPEAVTNLVASRIRNAERTMANNLSTGIYSDGTGSSGKQIDGPLVRFGSHKRLRPEAPPPRISRGSCKRSTSNA